MVPRDGRHPHKVALSWLRELRGLKVNQVAELTGISAGLLSDYEHYAERKLTRERLDFIAGAMGYTKAEMDRVLGWVQEGQSWTVARVAGSAAAARQGGEEAVAEFTRAAERFGQSLMDLTLRQGLAAKERQRGLDLWERLRRLTPAQQRRVVEEKPEFQSWGLCVAVCSESLRAAADNADRAVALAELAVFIAERVPGDEAWRHRVLGWAHFHLANAHRVHGVLPPADAALAQAQEHWQAGEGSDPAGILDPALVLGLESSLRREQRRFEEALSRVDEALALDRGELRPRLLIKKAKIFEETGDYALALATLSQARPLLTVNSEPRLLWAWKFNYAINFCHLDRCVEAEGHLADLRKLAATLRNELDFLHLRWLEGKVACGLGRHQEALQHLETVRQGFRARNIAYDEALVTLETAVLLFEMGQPKVVKRLARDLAPVFRAQQVHREARAALKVFYDAAEQEIATAALTRRIVAYLYRARHDPELTFGDFAMGRQGSPPAAIRKNGAGDPSPRPGSEKRILYWAPASAEGPLGAAIGVEGVWDWLPGPGLVMQRPSGSMEQPFLSHWPPGLGSVTQRPFESALQPAWWPGSGSTTQRPDGSMEQPFFSQREPRKPATRAIHAWGPSAKNWRAPGVRAPRRSAAAAADATNAVPSRRRVTLQPRVERIMTISFPRGVPPAAPLAAGTPL